MPRVALTLCGRTAVEVDGTVVPSGEIGAKGFALLAYLALERGPQPRAALATLLWGETSDERARASLRQALAALRRVAGDALEVTRERVALADAVACDARALLGADDEARQAAATLDVGRFLEDVALRAGDAFAEWADATRALLRRRQRDLLAALTREALARRDWPLAARLADRWLEADPLGDDAAREAIGAHHLAGDRGAALRVFDAYRTRLAAETGRAPSVATTDLASRIAHEPAVPASRDPETRPAPSFEVSLRGRAREWALLADAWNRVRRDGARTVLVEGDVGVGKSRLLGDFLRWLATDGGLVLRARGYETASQVPFGALRELLRDALDAPGLAGCDPQWLAAVAHLLPELYARFPHLPRASAPTAMDDWRLHEGIAQLLLAVAEECPLALHLDDAQWCDGPSAGALHVLARRLTEAPLLLCVSSTPGAAPREAPGARLARALRGAENSVVIALEPLDEEELWRLVRELGHVAAPDGARQLAARLHDVTGGNPFYAIELLKTLFAQEWLAVDSVTGEWTTRAADAVHELPLPTSVTEAVAERVLMLPPEMHELLLSLAVAGRGCRPEELSRLHGISRLRAAALGDALIERHLAVEEGGVYRCAHPVIAQVTRASASTVRLAEVRRGLGMTDDAAGERALPARGPGISASAATLETESREPRAERTS